MIKSDFLVFLLVVLISLLVVSPLLAAETSVEQTAFNNGKAVIAFADKPLKAMTEVPFSITLSDEHGQLISDAKLSINMDMPAMPMPLNRPLATWDNGAYHGKAIFTMAGAWRVIVNIQSAGLGQDEVVFDIDQVMMK